MGPAFRGACGRALLVLAALAVPGVASARDWLFDVTLDGISIGTHRYALRDDGSIIRHLVSDAHFRVRLLLIDAYRWDHHAEETWRGDCLAALDSTTTEHGKTIGVAGRAEEGAFVIAGPAGRESAGACAMTFAYWNPRIFAQRALINPQTGASTPIEVRPLPPTQVTVHGKPLEATGYRVDTDRTRIEAFYDAAGEWIGLRSTTREGHVLEYRQH
jgi:hypothetical protein